MTPDLVRELERLSAEIVRDAYWIADIEPLALATGRTHSQPVCTLKHRVSVSFAARQGILDELMAQEDAKLRFEDLDLGDYRTILNEARLRRLIE